MRHSSYLTPCREALRNGAEGQGFEFSMLILLLTLLRVLPLVETGIIAGPIPGHHKVLQRLVTSRWKVVSKKLDQMLEYDRYI
jgi:hypothetical protein